MSKNSSHGNLRFREREGGEEKRREGIENASEGGREGSTSMNIYVATCSSQESHRSNLGFLKSHSQI